MPPTLQNLHDAPRDYTQTAGMVDPLTFGQATPKPDNVIREITIRQLSYGYVVGVGCQTFAIETASELISRLATYILQPSETEQRHMEGKFFK